MQFSASFGNSFLYYSRKWRITPSPESGGTYPPVPLLRGLWLHITWWMVHGAIWHWWSLAVCSVFSYIEYKLRYAKWVKDRCTQFWVIVVTDPQANTQANSRDRLQFTAPLSLACSVKMNVDIYGVCRYTSQTAYEQGLFNLNVTGPTSKSVPFNRPIRLLTKL